MTLGSLQLKAQQNSGAAVDRSISKWRETLALTSSATLCSPFAWEASNLQLPFRTAEGLFLEREDLLIPWGTPLNESTLGAPEVLENEEGWVFVWRSRFAMGGLMGDVVASRHKHSSARMFPHGLPTLHSILMLASVVALDDVPTDAIELVARLRQQLKRNHDVLEGAIGPASCSYPGYHLGLPSIRWEGAVDPNGDPMHFSCAIAGNRDLSVSVSHWTDQYPALRPDAEELHRLWARTDARVPFIAWEPDDPRIPEGLRRWRVGYARHQVAQLQRQLQRQLRARPKRDRAGPG